jgi:hypothetical protein
MQPSLNIKVLARIYSDAASPPRELFFWEASNIKDLAVFVLHRAWRNKAVLAVKEKKRKAGPWEGTALEGRREEVRRISGQAWTRRDDI